MDHAATCIQFFKPIVEDKKNVKTLHSTPQQQMAECYTPDYVVFQKLHRTFETLRKLITYIIICHEPYHQSLTELFGETDIKINPPKTTSDLILMYKAYPLAIEEWNDKLFEIVDMPDYPAIYMLYNRINPLLYYSLVTDQDTSDKIMVFEESVNEFEQHVENMYKPLLKRHVGMVVESAKQKVKNSKQTSDSKSQSHQLQA